MYVKCIDAHGSKLIEGRVYETDMITSTLNVMYVYLKCDTPNGGYRRDRFVEATKVDLLIAINKGEIKMEE
jgi:hypothetical protein